MPANLSGKVAVYGIDGTVAYTGMVKTANILKGGSLTESHREAQLERQGIVVGKAADLRSRQISVTIVPYASDASPTLVEAKALVLLATPLSIMTIDDYDITIFDGDWNIVGTQTVTTREDGFAEISFTGEQHWNGSAFAALPVVA